MNSHRPRTVALIPCYAARAFIREAVEGLLTQTLPLDLIVVLDDRSGDGFEEEIADLVEKHDHLIIHINPKNLGVSECRNEGFHNYPADYYILNDADDISTPDRVEKSIRYMEEHPQCGILGSFITFMTSNGRDIGRSNGFYSFNSEDAARYRNSLDTLGLIGPTLCVRGKVYHEDGIKFNASLLASEDTEFVNIILEKGWDAICYPEYLCRYRIHGNSICAKKTILVNFYGKYVADRLVRRRTGKAPISYEEYMLEYKKRPLKERWKTIYDIYASKYYRNGGALLMDNKYFRGAFVLGFAILMRPRYINKLLSQLKQR